MKSAFSTLCLVLAFFSVFSFNENPRNWNQGVLYEKKSGASHYYLYIDPKGPFIWIKDDGNQTNAVQGVWKRNPITNAIKFCSDFIGQSKYIQKPLHIKEEGLFLSSNDRPLFKLAGSQPLAFLLPQIREAIELGITDYDFYSIDEIGKKQEAYVWNQEAAASKDAFEVIKQLGQAEYKAQKWSDEKYGKERSSRRDWNKSYPNAFAAGKALFGSIKGDSAKVRAMCNWMEKQLKYDLAGSRKDNAQHSPEVFYNLKYGLCLDYARLLNVFCESVGIPCFDIAGYPIDTQDGKTTTGRDSYHAWNYVKVNGQWLAVDPTWYSKRQPREHFLIPLAAYQYQHVPDHQVEIANPFAPQNRSEINLCPVVKQYNMELVYLGQYETMTEVNDGGLRVCIYAKSPQTLNLHIDSVNTSYHMLSFTFRIGGGAYTLENIKGKRHKTYQLQKGLNWINIPLVSSVAEYTLINDDFEWSIKAYRANQKSLVLKRLTDYNDSTWCVTQAYGLMEKWLEGEEVAMHGVSDFLRQHPNWEFIRQDYHNQQMDYWVVLNDNKRIANFGFTSNTIGGRTPIIRMEIDEHERALSPASFELR